MQVTFDDILESERPRAEKARMIADRIRMAKGYPWAGLYEVGEKEIGMIACAGRTEPAIPSFPRDKGLNGRAVSQGRTVVVNDTSRDEDYLLTFRNTKAEIVVPVLNEKKAVVGTIDVEGEAVDAFHEDDVAFLEECARQIARLWRT